MYKNVINNFFVLLMICSLLLTGCNNNISTNINKNDVYQIGVGWVDNIMDAHSKLENSSNEPSKEANLKYLSNSVNYFLETLEHATDSEKEVLSDYFSKKAAEVGKDTEYFLEFGGKSEND